MDRPVNRWMGHLMEHWNEGNLQALTSRRPKSNDERPLRGKKIERVEFANPETGSDVSVQFFFKSLVFYNLSGDI